MTSPSCAPTDSDPRDDIGGTERASRDPWARFGWLMWSVWLLFLVFPLVEVFQAHDALAPRLVGIALIGAFAVVYVTGSAHLMRHARPRPAAAVLATLCLVAVLLSTVIGLEALGLVPFLVSFTTFIVPRPWNWAATLGWIAVTVLIPGALDTYTNWTLFTVIVVAVGVASGAGRLLMEHGEEYSMVQGELAITEERDRVARDVHDVLGHSLTVVALKAQLAERLIRTDPDRAQAEMAEIQTLTRDALAEIRSTVGALRATRLEEELAAARSALAAAEIEANLPQNSTAAAPQRRSVMAWALREAVTNVVRHSQARVCTVELGAHRLSVSDDGVGIGPGGDGNGLRGLRERVEAASGTVRIGPGAGGVGTSVEVSW